MSVILCTGKTILRSLAQLMILLFDVKIDNFYQPAMTIPSGSGRLFLEYATAQYSIPTLKSTAYASLQISVISQQLVITMSSFSTSAPRTRLL